MARIKFNYRSLDRLKPEPGRTRFHYDATLPGFGIKVAPTGRKTFFAEWKTRDRKTRRKFIGSYPPVIPASARAKAQELLSHIKIEGDLPAQTDAVTFASVADRFLREHAIPKKKPKSAHNDRLLINRILIPAWGNADIRSIDQAMVARLHHRLTEKTPTQANRTVQLVSKIINLSEDWGLRDRGSNPCRYIQKNPEKRRERWLNQEERARLWATLSSNTGWGNRIAPGTPMMLRLLFLTGARSSEIRLLRWEQVDMDRGFARLEDSKTGPKLILFPPMAMQLLNDAHWRFSCPWVCPNNQLSEPIADVRKTWVRVLNRAGISHLRIHDLRHGFASAAAQSGIGLSMVGALLGHASPRTTARYSHFDDASLRRAITAIEKELLGE